ncbi:uncharacterized protein LOC109537850 isoform X2 [Dendroctonus ponderosae]|uniref:uncharacterized protein LOC109537850 isoform X2 n=1 Tax=Dendroctonus ponderosae TaxID=77166 RepID=UPI002034C902|nr:uncharacterized protein LOC109537850 isoform X2 [Dendroctonus ponderosae]KAH1016028.1 hypothetical protein HUJ04_007313 [Dendroctonus ponderosae]
MTIPMKLVNGRLKLAMLDYVSPCWVTALLSSLIFFMMVLLMVSSIGSSRNLRVPRCTHSNPEELSNKTIHLVHQSSDWSQEQVNFLEKIKSEYQGYDVHLVLVRQPSIKGKDLKKHSHHIEKVRNRNLSVPVNRTFNSIAGIHSVLLGMKRAKRSKKNARALRRKKRGHEDSSSMGLGLGVKYLLDILLRSKIESTNVIMKKRSNDSKPLPDMFNLTDLFSIITPKPRPKTLEDIIDDFPGLTVKNATAEEIFFKSPLQHSWAKFNSDLLLFAVRAMYLWQYGGLSFKVDGNGGDGAEWENVEKFSVAPVVTLQNLDHTSIQMVPHEVSTRNDKLHKFILAGRTTFENMPQEVVTADDEGLHIFTKSPCHAFFGEVLGYLRRARGDETPKMIIRKSLKVFCKYAAVGNNYCRNLVRGTV